MEGGSKDLLRQYESVTGLTKLAMKRGFIQVCLPYGNDVGLLDENPKFKARLEGRSECIQVLNSH